MATETEDVPISEPAAQNAGATESGDPGKFLAWDIAFEFRECETCSIVYVQSTYNVASLVKPAAD